MKKVLSIAAMAAMTTFVISCGDGGAAAKADSTKKADSAHGVFVTDSTNKAVADKKKADSMAKADADMKAKMAADSTMKADSMAKAGSKKPMTPKQKEHIENKKATSGRG
ncbi:MAG: hypothetical protein HY064_11765 [Bacteroidetes bacterium]|nr:hypothetical protein [Bacteroidota bacterium]